MNNSSKLTTRPFQSLGLGVGFTASYDSAPPAPTIPWDTRLAVTLEYLL